MLFYVQQISYWQYVPLQFFAALSAPPPKKKKKKKKKNAYKSSALADFLISGGLKLKKEGFGTC